MVKDEQTSNYPNQSHFFPDPLAFETRQLVRNPSKNFLKCETPTCGFEFFFKTSCPSSLTAMLPMDTCAKDTCGRIVEEIRHHPLAAPFSQPVQWREWNLHDYPLIVKQPMDLKTVAANLYFRKYDTINTLWTDIALIWHNCILYNGADHDYGLAAAKLRLFTKLTFANHLGEVAADTLEFLNDAIVSPCLTTTAPPGVVNVASSGATLDTVALVATDEGKDTIASKKHHKEVEVSPVQVTRDLKCEVTLVAVATIGAVPSTVVVHNESPATRMAEAVEIIPSGKSGDMPTLTSVKVEMRDDERRLMADCQRLMSGMDTGQIKRALRFLESKWPMTVTRGGRPHGLGTDQQQLIVRIAWSEIPAPVYDSLLAFLYELKGKSVTLT